MSKFISSFKDDFQANLFTVYIDSYENLITLAKTLKYSENEALRVFSNRILRATPISGFDPLANKKFISFQGITKEILDEEAPIISKFAKENENAQKMLGIINNGTVLPTQKGKAGRYYGIGLSHDVSNATIEARVENENANSPVRSAGIFATDDGKAGFSIGLKPLDALPSLISPVIKNFDIKATNGSFSLNATSEELLDTKYADISLSSGINLLDGKFGPNFNVELFDYFTYSINLLNLFSGIGTITETSSIIMQTAMGFYNIFSSGMGARALSNTGVKDISFRANDDIFEKMKSCFQSDKVVNTQHIVNQINQFAQRYSQIGAKKGDLGVLDDMAENIRDMIRNLPEGTSIPPKYQLAFAKFSNLNKEIVDFATVDQEIRILGNASLQASNGAYTPTSSSSTSTAAAQATQGSSGVENVSFGSKVKSFFNGIGNSVKNFFSNMFGSSSDNERTTQNIPVHQVRAS
jgi:hypothetical protein